MTPLLVVDGLTIAFGGVPVVSDVSFEVGVAGRLGLIGESGSGKSLTALAVLGLLPENARVTGSVRWRGEEVLHAPESVLTRLRGNDIAMVFQEPMTALDPTMKVGRQVAEVIRLHDRRSSAPPRQRVEGSARVRTVGMLGRVGLPDPPRIADAYPHQLSGGQRQRVVLAMALVNRPDLVICDEPTTALDVTVQALVLRLLDEVLSEQGAACLFISHDLAVVAQVCSDVVVLRDGLVVEAGPVAQVLGSPQHPYTAGLVATARLDRVEPGARLPTLEDYEGVR